ncbi:MAG: helix-turn-helix domain-containing protein [Lachnospiraceae bacterium]|jgi:transcriptional regulator with XRE-family HTH domain|nr:helix-turn-helix domain-containing protein [Lachnospiraceae bacterium]
MSDDEQKRIFAKNLNRYISSSGKTQKEIADRLDVSPQTFNTWCQGIALPRMGKVQALADYFGILKSDLIDAKSEASEYYINEDAREMAQFLFDNPDYKVLFDASRRVHPEDISFVKDMIERLRRNE